MVLRIRLLGLPEISRDGEPLALPGHRPLALLAYLLISGKPQSREHLANLLFDRPNDPRAALRWTLLQIRKSVGSQTILANRREIAFNFQSDYWLDVAAFEAGDLDCYRGELLQGLMLRAAHQYDAWLLVERERLRVQYQNGLERKLEAVQESEDAAAIESTALQLLQLDNLREDWHQALMRAYARQGKYEAAQAQFELCRQILREELATDPAPVTVALAGVIQRQQADLYRAVVAQSPDSVPLSGSTEPNESRPPMPNQKGTIVPERSRPTNSGNWSLASKSIISVAGLAFLVTIVAFGINYSRQFTGRTAMAGAIQDDNISSGDFAGTTVTMLIRTGDDYVELFEKSLAPFEEESGITINLLTSSDYADLIPDLIASGATPDLVMFPQPGLLAEFVRQGQIVDVRTFLDEAYLRQQYSDALLEAAVIEGQMAGIWHKSAVKSLVWYPKQAFNDAGYEVPTTWAELKALSDQIVADGGTPWCIGIESGAATGWVGTDWVEDILLRTAPVASYDAWVAGEMPFDSPEIRRVYAIMEDIWLKNYYVYGGPLAILTESWYENSLHLLANPPSCLLHRQASFVLQAFPDDVTYGQDYDVFYLPPIDAKFGRPILGAGDIIAMFNDRPEVREVMRYLATAESIRYLVIESGVLSPHRDVPFEWYSDPALLKITHILAEADAYRFDGSDLMPAKVGGAFHQGIVDWVKGADLDSLLSVIDDSWPRDE